MPMQFHLNKRTSSLFVLEELNILISEISKNPKFNFIFENIDSIDLVRHTVDPVQVFMDYWNEEKVQGTHDRKYEIENGDSKEKEIINENPVGLMSLNIVDEEIKDESPIQYKTILKADPVTPERQQYIKNALYAVKGAPEVFNAIERCFEIRIGWEYTFPVIEVLEIETIILSNVTLFESKLKYLIFHLLYYTDLNLYIKNLLLALRGSLVNNHALMTKPFSVVKTTWSKDDIF